MSTKENAQMDEDTYLGDMSKVFIMSPLTQAEGR